MGYHNAWPRSLLRFRGHIYLLDKKSLKTRENLCTNQWMTALLGFTIAMTWTLGVGGWDMAHEVKKS